MVEGGEMEEDAAKEGTVAGKEEEAAETCALPAEPAPPVGSNPPSPSQEPNPDALAGERWRMSGIMVMQHLCKGMSNGHTEKCNFLKVVIGLLCGNLTLTYAYTWEQNYIRYMPTKCIHMYNTAMQ